MYSTASLDGVLFFLCCHIGPVLQSKISWAVMGSIASIAVARGAQVWSRAQLTRQQMQDAMVDSLYQKAADSQEGVLHTVLDEMCDQHTRETIIAYAVLMMRGWWQYHVPHQSLCMFLSVSHLNASSV